MIILVQKERDGLIAPRTEREALDRPLSEHLSEYVTDLEAMGRTPTYVRLVDSRNKRLIRECGWKTVRDVSSDSFVTWRSRQGRLSPKTLNEYLNAATSLGNWLIKQNRVALNPLSRVGHVEIRGKQQRRRALSDPEIDRLLTVSGKDRLLYLTAIFTGLRLGELRQLVWGDINLSAERSFIRAREGTTKNRKEALIPLHSELVPEFQSAMTENESPDKPVFVVGLHPERRFRANLEAARIDRIDKLGRKVDFHALRHTFATKLARQGVPQRLAQELMRHSDPKLTAMIYTDVSQLPTFDAIQKLDWIEQVKPSIGGEDTQMDSHRGAVFGQRGSEADTIELENEASQLSDIGIVRHESSCHGTDREMAGATGLEPATSAVTGQRSNQLSYAPLERGQRTYFKSLGRVNGELQNFV